MTLGVWLAAMILVNSVTARDFARDDFVGSWTAREKAGDTCFIVLQASGRASCFWSSMVANVIERGQWTFEAGRVQINWKNGHRDILEVENGVLMRKTYPPELSLSDTPDFKTHIKPIDPNMVGTFRTDDGSQPPERSPALSDDPADAAAPETSPTDETEASARRISGEAAITSASNTGEPSFLAPMPLRSDFVGYWKVEPEKSDPFFVRLMRDGRAEAALRDAGNANTRGRWRELVHGVRIDWEGGREDSLVPSEEGYVLNARKPERKLFGESDRLVDDYSATIARADPREVEGHFRAASTNFFTPDDFLGVWEVVQKDGTLFFVKFERYGEAVRVWKDEDFEMKEAYGRWDIVHDGLQINWQDGSRYILRLTDAGFVLALYEPGSSMSDPPSKQLIASKR